MAWDERLGKDVEYVDNNILFNDIEIMLKLLLKQSMSSSFLAIPDNETAINFYKNCIEFRENSGEQKI